MAKASSPLLNKYMAIYRKKPRSRVFAPLAETYRKLGMLTEAINLLNEGIKNHPSYLLGYITLGNCYFDLKKYDLAYTSLRPFVAGNRDNLTLQRLFAKVCEHTDKNDEALETYKFLLYLNPKDFNLAKKVEQLESSTSYPVITAERDTQFEIQRLDQSIDLFADADDWVQVNFKEQEDKTSTQLDSKNSQYTDEKIQTEDSIDVEEAADSFVEKPTFNLEALDSSSQNDLFDPIEDDAPILTHTLADIYRRQGHTEKAFEVLQKIFALNPEDQETLIRLEEVRKELEGESEDDGRQKLMQVFDQKFPDGDDSDLALDKDDEKVEKLKKIYERYLFLVKQRASLNP